LSSEKEKVQISSPRETVKLLLWGGVRKRGQSLGFANIEVHKEIKKLKPRNCIFENIGIQV